MTRAARAKSCRFSVPILVDAANSASAAAAACCEPVTFAMFAAIAPNCDDVIALAFPLPTIALLNASASLAPLAYATARPATAAPAIVSGFTSPET